MAAAMQRGQAPRILVVDDNELNRALVKDTLEGEGHEVILASSGEEALRAFEAHRPDCVLLDIRMPGMDGTVVCSKIRSLPHGTQTPILFLTALRDVESFDRAIDAGGDDFLTKPVRPSELIVHVEAALKVRRLSARLSQQCEVVRHQRDALMRLQLQKERLSGFIVHDLKNPLSAIDLHAQVVLRTHHLPASVRDSVERIRDQGRAMHRLILNLLDISKAEESQLSPVRTDVDLEALVTAVLDGMAIRAKDGVVTLKQTLSAVARVKVDGDLLRRVLENLVENALRHAPKESAVHVTAARHGSEVEIRVQDAGRGVAPELRERVFERFFQVDAGEQPATRAGQGLGLTFCKLAVEAQGGRIWVEDAAPGAVFCVRIGELLDA